MIVQALNVLLTSEPLRPKLVVGLYCLSLNNFYG